MGRALLVPAAFQPSKWEDVFCYKKITEKFGKFQTWLKGSSVPWLEISKLTISLMSPFSHGTIQNHTKPMPLKPQNPTSEARNERCESEATSLSRAGWRSLRKQPQSKKSSKSIPNVYLDCNTLNIPGRPP